MLRAGLLSFVLLLASRVLGLLRESAQAAAFGSSGVADAAVLMLSLPDWITGLVAAGALSYVLLPLWARQGAAAQAQSARGVARVLLLIGAGLGGCLWLGRDAVVAALAPGLAGAAREAASAGLRYAALALPLALLAALWGTRAQHQRDFTGLYGANLVVNGVLVIALLLIATEPEFMPAIDGIGCFLLVAMAARLGWLAWRRRRLGDGAPARPSADRAAAQPGLPGLATWLWAALAAGLPLALPLAARSFASGAGEGALATFSYAWKLVELPLVLAVQLAAALSFPRIAAAYAPTDASAVAPRATAQATVRAALALAWTLACMAAAGLLVGAPALGLALFGWGRMTAEALAPLAQWARIGAWSLLPQAVIAVALTALASQARLRAAAVVWTLGLGLSLLGGGLLPAAGAAQMGWLAAVYAAVALGLVAALGMDARHVLPLRLMGLTSAVLVALAWATAAHGPWALAGVEALAAWPAAGALGRAQTLAAPLMGAGLAAAGLGALAWALSADLRAALHRQ